MIDRISVRPGAFVALALTLAVPSAFAQEYGGIGGIIGVSGASQGGLASLSGTWTVTGAPSASNRADCDSSTLAYQWILNVQPDGAASVTVQGQTSFPTLQGRVSGTSSSASITVSGLKLNTTLQGVRLYESSEFKLSGSGTSLSGTRTWGGYGEATDGGMYPLFCSHTVTARKL